MVSFELKKSGLGGMFRWLVNYSLIQCHFLMALPKRVGSYLHMLFFSPSLFLLSFFLEDIIMVRRFDHVKSSNYWAILKLVSSSAFRCYIFISFAQNGSPKVGGLMKGEVTDLSIRFTINTLLSLRKAKVEEFIVRTACRLKDPHVSHCSLCGDKFWCGWLDWINFTYSSSEVYQINCIKFGYLC